MQRRIVDEVQLGQTVLPFDRIGQSTAIDKAVSNFSNANENVQKIKRLINTGEYDEDIARYIPGTLDLAFRGIIENIDTEKQPDHTSYKNMENLEFQIMLTQNYYINPNSIHIGFPMKIKKAASENSEIDTDSITQ